MQKKTQLFVFLTILVLLLVFINMHFLSCASTAPQQQEMTPERKKAIQDSLFNLHKRAVQLQFSFGFEPYKQGDYAKAKRYFKRVAELDTSGIYGEALYQRLGDCYVRLQKPDSAEWAFKMGIERLPDEPYSYTMLAYIYRRGGRTDEATEMYEILTGLRPDSVSYHQYLAQLYVTADETEKAIASYQRVVELNPADHRSQEILSSLLARTGNIDQLIDLIH